MGWGSEFTTILPKEVIPQGIDGWLRHDCGSRRKREQNCVWWRCDRPTSHSTDTCIHQHHWQTDNPQQQTTAYLNISILGTWCPTDSWQITSVALLAVTSSYEPPARKLNQSYIWNTFFWAEATRYQVCCNIRSTKPAFPLRSWGWTNSISSSRSLGSSRMAVCFLYPSLNKNTLD